MQPLGRSSRFLRALIFKTGQTTSYATGDDGTYQVGENHNYEVLTTGQYSGTTSIVLNGKTEVKSNACVMDHASGLMWARTISASVGPTSNGLLPWTTNGNGEGIFTYAAAANAALFAGYGNDPDPLKNWRVPTDLELLSIRDMEATTASPNAIAFPVWGTSFWSCTTVPTNTANAQFHSFLHGAANAFGKTNTALVALVRGPLL